MIESMWVVTCNGSRCSFWHSFLKKDVGNKAKLLFTLSNMGWKTEGQRHYCQTCADKRPT